MSNSCAKCGRYLHPQMNTRQIFDGKKPVTVCVSCYEKVYDEILQDRRNKEEFKQLWEAKK